VPEGDYLKEYEIFPHMNINIYGREFELNSADNFTVFYYDKNYNRAFPLGPNPNPAS